MNETQKKFVTRQLEFLALAFDSVKANESKLLTTEAKWFKDNLGFSNSRDGLNCLCKGNKSYLFTLARRYDLGFRSLTNEPENEKYLKVY